MQSVISEVISGPDTSEFISRDVSLPKVLVAEDDPLYRRVLEHFLTGKGYSVQMVADGSLALQRALLPEAPQLLVLDWMMPGLQGPEVCRQIRQHGSERYQYVLLLTSKHTTADIVAGLEAGADDYLTKPFNIHELLARVRVGDRMIKLYDRLLAAQQALRFQATHDALTGVWNRGALFELLTGEVYRALRKASAISLFMIDLDYFKRVNDQFGHQAGDAILQEFAQRLGAAVRPYDVVGRYGGEEFIVAAAELGSEGPRQFAERLRVAVSALPVSTPEAQLHVTVSIGVVTAQPCIDCSVEKLIQAADAALYEAKRNGRNRVETTRL